MTNSMSCACMGPPGDCPCLRRMRAYAENVAPLIVPPPPQEIYDDPQVRKLIKNIEFRDDVEESTPQSGPYMAHINDFERIMALRYHPVWDGPKQAFTDLGTEYITFVVTGRINAMYGPAALTDFLLDTVKVMIGEYANRDRKPGDRLVWRVRPRITRDSKDIKVYMRLCFEQPYP